MKQHGRSSGRVKFKHAAQVFGNFIEIFFPEFFRVQCVVANAMTQFHIRTVGLDLDGAELSVPLFVVRIIRKRVVR